MGCDHNCGECGENCAERQGGIEKERLHELSRVKKVIGVISGKGGVGKSLVTSLMAVAMQRRGYRTAIMDADITGPSIPRAFGVSGAAFGDESGILPMETAFGTQVMSINFLLENETDPVVWRGPVLAGMVKNFWTQVVWKDVDYMFVDMPPGTGDVPLTVMQSLPLDGVIVVSTPQDLVEMIVAKAVKMTELLKIPVIGFVENMSYFKCPSCGKNHRIFGESKAEKLRRDTGKPVEELPIDPTVASLADHGKIELIEENPLTVLADAVEKL
ncbi:MAG: Mrp/NBP35 family ATP-binding protein [Clostridia bacterium]|nr:Mrp/NBP35 family ATP-binding protein [Clostridia bacterium]